MRKLVHTASFAWTANLFVNRLQFVTFIRGKTTEWCPSFFLPKQLKIIAWTCFPLDLFDLSL